MRNLTTAIQNDIRDGFLSFAEIAHKHEVPVSWVNEAWDDLCEQEMLAETADYDHLERDSDEEYIPDPDSWYEDQYDLGDY
jgi:hypothetical protein